MFILQVKNLILNLDGRCIFSHRWWCSSLKTDFWRQALYVCAGSCLLCGYLMNYVSYILELWAQRQLTQARQPFIKTRSTIIHSYTRKGTTCRRTLCGPRPEWCCWPDCGPFLKPWWSLETLSGWCGRSWSMWLRRPCSPDTGRLLCCKLRVLCRGANKETTVRTQETEGNVLCSVQTQHFGRAMQLPFSTLDVGIVRQKHGQKPHEVVSDWPLLPAGRHGPTVHAGWIHH